MKRKYWGILGKWLVTCAGRASDQSNRAVQDFGPNEPSAATPRAV